MYWKRRRKTPFWRREYYDRWMRSDRELSKTIAYVEENAVRKQLASCAEEWPWSRAFLCYRNAGGLAAC